MVENNLTAIIESVSDLLRVSCILPMISCAISYQAVGREDEKAVE